VVIDGRQILLDGQPFRVRGVNWNPIPKGATHPDGLDYAGFADQDIALMKAAGINAVRTYERLEDAVVLDKLHEAGIYVFSTVYGWHGDDPSVVTERVNAAKDHPAIMAWVLGNEWNYNQLYADDGNTPGARDKINQAAALIKQADPNHLIASIWGGTSELGATVALMPDIDIWGINFYGGLSLADVMNGWPDAGQNPMFLGEYGADAYNANTGSVDTAAQAEATRVLTQAIIDNYVTESGGVTVGGFIFEWSDEWWKDGGGSADVQDVGGIAPGGGPHPDQTFNEEFWGVVDIDRNPRPAYDELKALYAP
jgi:beta-galactosidase/beta-glucuronidase